MDIQIPGSEKPDRNSFDLGALVYTRPMVDDSHSLSHDAPKLPAAVAFAVSPGRALSVSPDGEVESYSTQEAEAFFKTERRLICHTLFSARRLGIEPSVPPHFHFDLMELFAFVRPTQFCLPTPNGLAHALGLRHASNLEDEALLMIASMERLLQDLIRERYPNKPEARRIAATMETAGWPWAEWVLHALGEGRSQKKEDWSSGLDIWQHLLEWQELAPEGEPGNHPVGEEEARAQLAAILGEDRTVRADQGDYAGLISLAFHPRADSGQPNIVIAEAGTGIGKTAGYLAPSSLWAEKNGPSVWISTYTKNLQRQIDQELSQVFPDPVDKAEKVVIRKGRENYLCLLNLQEAIGGSTGGRSHQTLLSQSTIAMGLVARWARYSRDGDMVGGDFPAWLTSLIGQHSNRQNSPTIQATGLTDRKGECIYSACTHYRKCFIERAIRRARHADIVVANHALVMINAAIDAATSTPTTDIANDRDTTPFPRLVFDEGHHLFDAADGTFSGHLTGLETAELRRWLRGLESGGRGRRGRGLIDRIGDLLGDIEDAESALHEIVQAASVLPAPGWMSRIGEGVARGPVEEFLAKVRAHVLARADRDDPMFSMEAQILPLTDGIEDIAISAKGSLLALAKPMMQLARALDARLDSEADALDSSTRVRIEAAAKGLRRRANLTLPSWTAMLDTLISEQTPEEFVDWFAFERIAGRDLDVGMYRHWIDPTIPFAKTVLEPAQGVLITSATLRDHIPVPNPDDAEFVDESWQSAELRTGASHLPMPAIRAHFPSPFDYQAQTKVLIVNDINRNSREQISSAYRELFKAAGGGALGIFTAIARLRATYEQIARPLHEAGLPLFAQHVDAMDTGTLVDLFRAEENSCLLGTDSVRDGVDVPGRSLRLIVFDRVPWPQPNLLHKARRQAFGKKTYDDMLTRFRLKQAFGRLIRHEKDQGIFVMLDSRLPSRLLSAFPEGVEVERIGLADTVATTSQFLNAS